VGHPGGQAFFLSNMSKSIELGALKPLIFFDDSPKNCADACESTPTVRVPVLETTVTTVISTDGAGVGRRTQFLGVCKLFLKKPRQRNLWVIDTFRWRRGPRGHARL
jgi:hypothetical protein